MEGLKWTSVHQLGTSGVSSQGRQVITFSFSLADTTNCWRTRNDLSSDNAKDVALSCGYISGRRDLHLCVCTAASCGLCGCCVPPSHLLALPLITIALAGEGAESSILRACVCNVPGKRPQ